MRNYIAIKGRDGEILNKLLTAVEKRGDEPVINTHLQIISTKLPKRWEFNRAIHSALKNWTTGEAKKLVTYGFNGGIDAWRRLYHEYLPLDQTKQDIIFTEITSLEAVEEKDVRAFLNRLEELKDKHDRCGDKPIAENIVKRVAMKCLPQIIIKPIAIALDEAQTLRQVRRLVTKQMHNAVTGMMDGNVSQPLYSVQDDKAEAIDNRETEEQDPLAAAAEAWDTAEMAYWAVAMSSGKGSKGKGGKSKGKGKGNGLAGYGECYNCGEWGHPARECPNPGKLHGGIPTAAAFKGGKGKGRPGKGKGKNGKGKGKYNSYNNKRSLNYASARDYNAAWGDQVGSQSCDWDDQEWPETSEGSYNCGFWGNHDNGNANNNNYSPNYAMLLMRTPCKVSGSKYFRRDLLLDYEDSGNEECDGSDHQLNSVITASCTVSRKQDGNKTKTKNRVGASHIKLQNNLPIANSDTTTYNTMTTTTRHDDDDDDHATRQTSLNHSTTQSHDNKIIKKQDDVNFQNRHRVNGGVCGTNGPAEVVGANEIGLKTLCCKKFNGVQDHASGTHEEEDRVDNVGAIQVQKDDAHAINHEGELQAAQ